MSRSFFDPTGHRKLLFEKLSDNKAVYSLLLLGVGFVALAAGISNVQKDGTVLDDKENNPESDDDLNVVAESAQSQAEKQNVSKSDFKSTSK